MRKAFNVPIVVYHNPVGLIGQLASNVGNFATGQAVFDQNLQASHLQQQAAAQAQQAAMEQARMDQQNQQFYDAQQHADDQLRFRLQEQQQTEKDQFANRQSLQEQQYKLQGANQQQLAGLQGGNAMQREQARLDAQQGQTSDRLDERYYRDQQQSQDRAAAQQTRQDLASATDQRLRDLAAQRGNNGQDPEFKQWAAQTQRMGQYISGLRQQADRVQSTLGSMAGQLLTPEERKPLEDKLASFNAAINELTPQHLQNIQNPPPPRQQFNQSTQGVYAGDETPSMQMGGYAPPPRSMAPPTIDQATFGQQQAPMQPPPPPVYQQPSALGYAPMAGQAPASPPPPLPPDAAAKIQAMIRAGFSDQQIRAAMGR